MSDQNFVHLHVHTEYSLLDGLSRIEKLVERAKALNMPSLAITDHGTMFGVMDFYRACKNADIKPIIGVEAYLARRSMQDRDPKFDKKPYHMLLLAQNQAGYKNLLKLASAAQLEGYYYRPRIDRDFLAAHAEGIIATSGCLAAQIPSMIMEGRDDEARALIGWYQDVFGKDNFYLELQQHDIPELETLNKWLLDYSKSNHTHVPLVATNDVHYVLESDYDPHDTLLCIQTGALKSEADRLRMSDASYHLTTPDEMFRFFGDIAPSALANTLKIAEMCEINLDDKEYHLPVFPVPPGHDSTSYLRYLCEKGMGWRYGNRSDEAEMRARLDRELGIIGDMGFNTYFLIVWDLCQFARHADIWWNVRGSGAGSLVAYSLDITNIDPIQNNLLFERFLNPGRVSMPDIDIDFPDDRREEMIYYTARKYGEDKVAAIITFGTLGAKAAVRDVGRALNVPLEIVNQAARLIPTEPKPKPIMTYVEENPELKQLVQSSSEIRQIVDIAQHLQGVNRHASTHAAGVIVADKPLVEYLPLHRPTKIEKTDKEEGEGNSENPLKAVTQFPMETCESIGLLKIDFLGLSTLTIMRKACDLIEQYHGIKFTMDNIPYRPTGDPEVDRQLKETFALIGRGDTVGIFQVEGTGMQQMLRDMRPTKFEHIIAAVSLYRPGPLEFIPQYNRRLRGEEAIEYRHPSLKPILEETMGICVTGDTLVFDVESGKRYRIDEIRDKTGNFSIQGVGENFEPSVGRVTHWIDNGIRDVYRLQLRNGATIKATANHLFLTEQGWKELDKLQVGDYVATPPYLIEPNEHILYDRRKLRVLAYLIADGSLGSFAAVDFVNKEQLLIDEYVSCLDAFEDIKPTYLTQIHDVTRVMTKKRSGKGTSPLLAWMRELGLKYAPNPDKRSLGGCRSHEKFVPEFVFQLNNDDLTFFLASLWDCDGHIGKKLCHYKTISQRLAYDVQTLLLRLGILSVIHRSSYVSTRGKREAYQVTLYDTRHLAELLRPYMLTQKREVVCQSQVHTTISRDIFLKELKAATPLSNKAIMREYGLDKQHMNRVGRVRKRISAHVVQSIAQTLELSRTNQLTNVIWQDIHSIEYAGAEPVYDLTVERLHNFVANNVIVHNCVYQEQIMQIAGDIFGYELGEADLMRRAVSKKKEKDLKLHRDIFLERGKERGLDADTTNKIFDDIEFFANYGFNKCLVYDTEIVDADSGRLVKIGDLATGKAQVERTLTCDIDTLRLKPGKITAAMENGTKPVYRLITQLGRQIEATANHPFYTFDGWRNLGGLKMGEQIAVTTVFETVRQPIYELELTASPFSNFDSQTTLVSGDDIYWDKIVSIEYVGEHPTYDLTIEGTHNFIANDILVHNSHAADYAVITCQTAYLKTLYPAEYMTALLSVHRDDIAKITIFLNECRRQNIPVLPPDVNYSALDFDIQAQADGTRGIRFGLVAIKNAGEAAVMPIINERKEGGPFASLEDFCRRVDLRQVQKRTLESLIKVGALDSFGTRWQLADTASLERIVNFSADYHRAKEIGQLSMFGESTGMDDHLGLSDAEEISEREMLNWEKELLGLYVSGRPADKIRDLLARANNTADVAEIRQSASAMNGKPISLAGEVTALRKVVTKQGHMMGIAQVEDWHPSTDSIEVVLFPRTWDKFGALVEEGNVLVFGGKVDNRRGDVQIICDTVNDKPNFMMPAEGEYVPPSNPEPPLWMDESLDGDLDMPTPPPAPEPEPEATTVVAPATQGAAAVPTPTLEPQLVSAPRPTPTINWMDAEAPDVTGLDLSAFETVAPPERWLMIYFKRSDDAEKDRRRLRRLHGILTKYPGKDRFSIVLEDQKQTFKMEFPNDTTAYCDDLMSDLLTIVGEVNNIEVFDRPQ